MTVSSLVLHVHHLRIADLLTVRQAGDSARFFSRLGEDRKQDSREDGDYRDDDEQFNEGEAIESGLGPVACHKNSLRGNFQ
jgi:hypothetical protein